MLDEHARLIGVNTFVRRVNKQGLPLEGLNYSLRSSAVLDWLGRQGVALTISGAPPEATAAGVPAPSASEDDANEMRSAPDAPHATAGLVAIEPVPDAPEPARLRPHDEDERDLCEFEGERGERLYGRPNRAFRMERALSDVYRATRHNAGEAFVELDGEAMEEF